MGGDNESRNLILAAVLAMVVVFAWQAFAPHPAPTTGQQGTQQATGSKTAPTPPAQGKSGAGKPAAGQPATAVPPQGATKVPQRSGEPLSRAKAIAANPRVPIQTPAVTGSIRLKGGRLDDLHLSRYRVSLKPGAPTVTLLNPAGGPSPYFIDYGWRRTVNEDPGPLPVPTTPWTVESGKKLTPTTPVVLRWDNGKGLIFRRKFQIDDNYMLTVTQSVENTTGAAVTLAPYGAIVRRGEPKASHFRVHVGAIGMFDGKLSEPGYGGMRDFKVIPAEHGPAEIKDVKNNGWLGFTDKYWMSTLIPKPGQNFQAVYRVLEPGTVDEFRTEARLPVVSVPAGGTVASTGHLFSGAKVVNLIRHYQNTMGIDRFVDAVDWGWFYFLTKPIFRLLNFIHGLVGNMGLAIITLTFLTKACLFPLAYKSFVAMSKMKKLQPEMERIKEQCGDDRQKLQQEIMGLYKKEKVNPASGCLPIVLQIPIFYSLYKVLIVTIEMRHAPFFGWIRDLSAPDPTSWINLFGLLPYHVPAFAEPVSIGFFPIMLGITMWLQQKLNPPPADPTQRTIFTWMPWVFMFMLGRFASGLVIYWCANNVLTFSQQYIIMRSQGTQVDLLGNIKSGLKPTRGGKRAKSKVGASKAGSKAEAGPEKAEAPADAETASVTGESAAAGKSGGKSGQRSGAKSSGRSGQRGGRRRSGGRA